MGERQRVAFVVQRYGRGGAETLCRIAAERLAQRYNVTVLTTRALDHETWANHFSEGETVENGVRVRRFSTAHPRSADFQTRLRRIFSGTPSRDEELAWLRAQGPHSPDLLNHLHTHGSTYDAVFFMTYLYEPTVLGLPMVAERAALISTAHDEQAIRLSIYQDVFRSPRQLIFLSPGEKRLVRRLFANDAVPGVVCSVGLDAPGLADGERFRRKHAIHGPLCVYVGRVESSKGCDTLIDWMRRYQGRRPVTLALLGQNLLNVRSMPNILPLGFVDESEKWDALAAADVFVIPSQQESYSFVTLEAWQAGRPVLVNGLSEVLRDHARASQGGLYYENEAEFGACLDYLLDHPDIAARMGDNGKRYVAANYGWDRIDAEYDRIIELLATNGRTEPVHGTR